MIAIKYLLRNGIDTDREALVTLLESNNMETNIDPCEFLLAEIAGELAGAARLEYEANDAHLRPIVVNAKWRGKNIGSALVKRIAQGVPELHVVARGEATGFYRKLGFLSISWDLIPERYRQECDACPDYKVCRPQLMVLTKSINNEAHSTGE